VNSSSSSSGKAEGTAETTAGDDGVQNPDKTGALSVPSDAVLLSLTDEGLKILIASLDRKLRLARQEVLVRSYGRPPGGN
jgi:hypothetical protein